MSRIMLDTNVLLDYFLGRDPGCSACKGIIEWSEGRHDLLVASLALKDVYYLVGATLKRAQRLKAGQLGEATAKECNEIAWACVDRTMEFSHVVPVREDECKSAQELRKIHDDFEDDLVLAACRYSSADFLVTGDEDLQKHAPVASLSPQRMLQLLMAEGER